MSWRIECQKFKISSFFIKNQNKTGFRKSCQEVWQGCQGHPEGRQEEEEAEKEGVLCHLHLQGVEAGPPWHWNLLQGHVQARCLWGNKGCHQEHQLQVNGYPSIQTTGHCRIMDPVSGCEWVQCPCSTPGWPGTHETQSTTTRAPSVTESSSHLGGEVNVTGEVNQAHQSQQPSWLRESDQSSSWTRWTEPCWSCSWSMRSSSRPQASA